MTYPRATVRSFYPFAHLLVLFSEVVLSLFVTYIYHILTDMFYIVYWQHFLIECIHLFLSSEGEKESEGDIFSQEDPQHLEIGEVGHLKWPIAQCKTKDVLTTHRIRSSLNHHDRMFPRRKPFRQAAKPQTAKRGRLDLHWFHWKVLAEERKVRAWKVSGTQGKFSIVNSLFTLFR